MNAILRKGTLYYWYAWGYRTHERAVDAAHNLIADCEISWSEDPQVEAYKTKEGERRFGVLLRAA
jgi:hypothetical protein